MVLGHWGVQQWNFTLLNYLITGVVIDWIQEVSKLGAWWSLLAFLTNTLYWVLQISWAQKETVINSNENHRITELMKMLLVVFFSLFWCTWAAGGSTEYSQHLLGRTESRGMDCAWKLLFSLPSLYHWHAQWLSSHSIKLEDIINIILPKCTDFWISPEVPNRDTDRGELLHIQLVHWGPVLIVSLGIVSGAGDSYLHVLAWSQLVVVRNREV